MEQPEQTIASGIDIEAWTVEQAISALSTVSISAVTAQQDPRQQVVLEIPLDDASVHEERRQQYARRREPLRRDSLKRREALLKGKEGSRRRQRWENNRLMGNPWMEPPEPRDYDIRPTHPVHAVPYYVAHAWEDRHAKDLQRRQLTEAREASRRNDEQLGKIPKDLRLRLKKNKSAKGMLQDLEEEIRKFVMMWDAKERELELDGLADVDSSEDEEIVFVGRSGKTTRESAVDRQQKALEKDKLIFESLVDDHGAAFGRWLVHSIAAYYDLRTWSKTTPGNPAKREAYVGIKSASLTGPLPQPLYISLCS